MFECDFCKKTYTTVSSLNLHQKTAKFCIKIQKEKNIQHHQSVFNCDFCKKEFSIKVKKAGGELRMLCDVNIVHEHGGASRINVETAALTKSEVIISHHIYIQNNFSKIQKTPSHILLVMNTLFFKFFLGILGCFLFFVPKARLQTLLFRNILKYYGSAISNKTWLSFRSFKFAKR
jgi:GT2 family glycosyltransferase